MEVKKVLVVGSGLMGGGIAQVCAQAGLDVLLNDVSEEALEKAFNTIKWSLGKFVKKRILKESADTILKRIRTVTELEAGHLGRKTGKGWYDYS